MLDATHLATSICATEFNLKLNLQSTSSIFMGCIVNNFVKNIFIWHAAEMSYITSFTVGCKQWLLQCHMIMLGKFSTSFWVTSACLPSMSEALSQPEGIQFYSKPSRIFIIVFTTVMVSVFFSTTILRQKLLATDEW